MSGAPTISVAAHLANLPRDQLKTVLADMAPDELQTLQWAWELWRRPDQTPPEGDWRVWALIAGRGAGKSWAGSQWVRAEIESGRRRNIALVAPTHLSGRKTMIEGTSGLLSICPPDSTPVYEMASSRLTWPNGGQAHLLSSETPDRARGFNFDGAWCDELAAWESPQDTWDQVSLATRVPGPFGDSPRFVITTTPRNVETLKHVLADPGTRITRASTFANAANLDPTVLAHLQARYGNTSLGRQELYGQIVEDHEGALWSRAMLDTCRVTVRPEMRRIVVSVDPSGGGKDECGIVVAGLGVNGEGYILQDLSAKLSPERWARRAVDAYHAHRADRIVCEQNFGGAMAESVIRSVDPNVPVRMVHASRGKQVRAEPVAALYEQRRVHHVGEFVELEDQLCGWSPNESSSSPDRLDGLVWAVTELMLTNQAKPARRVFINFMGR